MFDNRYRTAALTVVKSVNGQGASTTETFTFTITLTDASGARLAASYPYTGTGGAPSGTICLLYTSPFQGDASHGLA